MQLARRQRLASAKTGFDMGLPFNILNRVLDLGFKPLPWGDTGYLLAKYQPLGHSATAAPPAKCTAGLPPTRHQTGPAGPRPSKKLAALPVSDCV
jgi:hypothetical protein